MNINDIPDEIMSVILELVVGILNPRPPRYDLNYRLVCKHWHQLIHGLNLRIKCTCHSFVPSMLVPFPKLTLHATELENLRPDVNCILTLNYTNSGVSIDAIIKALKIYQVFELSINHLAVMANDLNTSNRIITESNLTNFEFHHMYDGILSSDIILNDSWVFALQLSSIKNLSIAGNQLDDSILLSLISVLNNTKIVILDLALNKFRDPGMSELLSILPKTKLRVLSLEDNLISDKLINQFVAIMPKTQLSCLIASPSNTANNVVYKCKTNVLSSIF
jgi:hypothetical protein